MNLTNEELDIIEHAKEYLSGDGGMPQSKARAALALLLKLHEAFPKKILINALNGNFYFDVNGITTVYKIQPDEKCVDKDCRPVRCGNKSHRKPYLIASVEYKETQYPLSLKREEAETIRTLILNECNKNARNILSHPMAEGMLENEGSK